jgi:hypothetical protein
MRKITSMKRKIISIVAGIIIFSSCYYDKEEVLYPDGLNCGTVPALFANNVNPIIQTRCAVPGCHAAGSTNGVGPLTSYTLIKNAAVQIKAAVVSGFMPRNSTLTPVEIKTISCWVDAGAPDN